MTTDEGTGEGASQRRVALVALDPAGKHAAQRAEPLLRLAFPGIWFSVTTFNRQHDGDLKRHARRVRADGLIVGPPAEAANPAGDWGLSVGGSVFGWAAPSPDGQPLWLLSPGRGEMHDGLELAEIPRSIRRRSRRLRQRRAQGPAAVLTHDSRSLALCGRIAAELAATATRPIALAFPHRHWPLLFAQWRAAVAEGLGAAAASAGLTLTPEEAAFLFVSGESGEVPAVTISTNLTASVIAAGWAGRFSPALVPRLLCGPKLRAAQAGHAAPAGGEPSGPAGILAAGAAVMFLLGRRAQAANLFRVLTEVLADPQCRPPEAGGDAPVERTVQALHAGLMRHVVKLSENEAEEEPAADEVERA